MPTLGDRLVELGVALAERVVKGIEQEKGLTGIWDGGLKGETEKIAREMVGGFQLPPELGWLGAIRLAPKSEKTEATPIPLRPVPGRLPPIPGMRR